jgi:hypothetical protein
LCTHIPCIRGIAKYIHFTGAGARLGEVCVEIELSKVLKIRRSRHAITSEQLAASRGGQNPLAFSWPSPSRRRCAVARNGGMPAAFEAPLPWGFHPDQTPRPDRVWPNAHRAPQRSGTQEAATPAATTRGARPSSGIYMNRVALLARSIVHHLLITCSSARLGPLGDQNPGTGGSARAVDTGLVS